MKTLLRPLLRGKPYCRTNAAPLALRAGPIRHRHPYVILDREMPRTMHGWIKSPRLHAAVLAAICTLAVPLAAQTTQAGDTTSADQPPVPTGTITHAAPVTYNNRYEAYGALSFMSFQAGQTLPHLMSLGGAELQGTYWVTPRIGVVLDGRSGAGTTPVLSPYYNRVVVYHETGLAGVNYRWLQNQLAALGVQAMVGATHGVFSYAPDHYPGGSPVGYCKGPNNLGLYCNVTKGSAAAGISIDINRSAHWAVRLAPEVLFTHFGTTTDSYFYLSGGVVYRIGHR